MDFSQYTDMISVCGCCSLSQYANIHNAYHQSGISGMMNIVHLVAVLPVPLVQQVDVVAHLHESLA